MEDAVRALQQQMNEFTNSNADTLELTLFDVESKSSQMWSKLRRNVRAHEFRLKMCGATQYKPNRSKSTSRTFDRGGVSVKACPMLIARAHMQHMTVSAVSAVSAVAAAEQQSSSQRVGALSLIPFCLGISGHPSGSRQGHPRYTGARSAGRPRVARSTPQGLWRITQTRQQTGLPTNMVAEQ